MKPLGANNITPLLLYSKKVDYEITNHQQQLQNTRPVLVIRRFLVRVIFGKSRICTLPY